MLNLFAGNFTFPLIRRPFWFMALDSVAVAVSFLMALFLRFEGDVPEEYLKALLSCILIVIPLYIFINYFFDLYKHIWHYASSYEVVNIFGSVAASTVLLALSDILWSAQRFIPLSVVFMGGVLTFVVFSVTRYRWRLVTGFFWRWRTLGGGYGCRMLIVGAGETGQLLAGRLQNQSTQYELVGFIDDDPNKWGRKIHGIPVLGNRHLIPTIVSEEAVDIIVIAIYYISGRDFRNLLSICQETTAQIKVLPNIFEMMGNHNGDALVRDITIEDLLGREAVEIDHHACRQAIAGKVVLVTGAGGSIGSELCRQVLRFDPELLLMLDRDETALHRLSHELVPLETKSSWRCLLGDICRLDKLEALFRSYRPQVIFHCAAYKHVDIVEKHPDEAVWVNVMGTRILCDLAQKYGTERFVFISTDKAVDPVGVMGATKRVGELLVTGLPQDGTTLFTAVRFGNVLGSRGSVVPVFSRQIEQGGPVTITDSQMTRFFMSIAEAVSLIIQAVTLTQGGEIFVLDMGEQIKIVDLARKMIRMRGLRIGQDIEIVYTGIRPGERLHEELVAATEKELPTLHPKIYCLHNNHAIDRATLMQGLDELVTLAEDNRSDEIVAKLQEMVKTANGNGHGG